MQPKIVVITGPTASGKTALGVALAQRLGGEVVSADSMQIYRGMDIGTAKPTPEEMQGVPHHMIDIADPAENYSVSRYAAQAAACLMWIVHYGLLGATTAATINILSFARSVVFYFNDRKWAQSRAWLWAFLALYVVNTVLTWAGPMSLLPGIAMSMTTVALWTRDMRRTRLLYLTNSPFWFTYDILARSYSCMVIEAIAFVSYAVAVWRFDIKKQPQA